MTIEIGPFIWGVSVGIWLITISVVIATERKKIRAQSYDRWSEGYEAGKEVGKQIAALEAKQPTNMDSSDLDYARAMHREWDAGYEAGKKETERKYRNDLWTTPPIPFRDPPPRKKRKSVKRRIERARAAAYQQGYDMAKEECMDRVAEMLEPGAARPLEGEAWPLYQVWKLRRTLGTRLAKAQNKGFLEGITAGSDDVWQQVQFVLDIAIANDFDKKPKTWSNPALSTIWAHAVIFRAWVDENTRKKEVQPNGHTEKLEPRPDAATVGSDESV
jgi:hypothetical protein